MESHITASQSLGQKIEDSLIQFAEAWRSKNWLRVLTTILGYWLICLSPTAIVAIIKEFTTPSLPAWLLWIWPLVGGFLFVSALVVASTKKEAERFVGSIAIKGLLPFERADAETFAKLGRSIPLSQCLMVLKSSSFRFGILNGESGCGKTSFLRAGILPQLNAESDFRCVYVEFTNRNPLETIREALIAELKPTEPLPPPTDLTLLFQAATGTGKPLVLLFDQFEQVFFQSRHSVETDPLFRALADWYSQRMQHGHRILLCWRRDYYYQSMDLLKIMGGNLGFQDLFSLEKFTPKQAADVFKVMADEANLQFDQSFVETMIEDELADKETQEGSASLKVSPVAVQILAWLVAGQQATDTRAFDRAAFRELGGVEGLMERFLRRVLEGRGPKSQTDVKVLLTLTNRDTGTRAGLLPHGAIQEKDKSLTPEDIDESLNFLGSPQARLIIQETTGCKLAHERLIPALLKIAGGMLGPQERANQLLNRRVSMWVENGKKSRFLLDLSEWLLIRKHRPAIVWGSQSQEADKRDLINRTAGRWQLRLGFVVAVLIMGVVGYGLLQSPWGQIQQLKFESNTLRNDKNSEVRYWVVKSLIAVGDTNSALTAAQGLSPYHKLLILGDVAITYATLKQPQKAKLILDSALVATQGLPSQYKPSVFFRITTAYATLGAKAGVDSVLTITKGLSNTDSNS